MAFIPVPNTVLAELVFSLFGQVVENTLWFENVVEPNIESMQDLAGELHAWYSGNIIPHLSQDLTLNLIRVTSMDTSTAPVVEAPITVNNVGLVASASLPGNDTWTVKFTTGFRGRSFRGRNYIPGIPTNVKTGNQVSSAFGNNMILGYAALPSELLTSGWQHVVVSRFQDGEPLAVGVSTPVIAYGYVDLFLDSQRRRLTGRGE